MVNTQLQETWPDKVKADLSGEAWAALWGKKSRSAKVLPEDEEDQDWVLEQKADEYQIWP